jgi:hypothetical protein
MQHSHRSRPGSREGPANLNRETGSRRHFAPHGASMRMAAAMAWPGRHAWERYGFEAGEAQGRPSPFEAMESDAWYFRRRSHDERRAADDAAGPEARAAHRELAARYALLSRPPVQTGSIAASRDISAAGAPLAMPARGFGLTPGDIYQGEIVGPAAHELAGDAAFGRYEKVNARPSW